MIYPAHDEKYFLCGREDGAITVHHLKTCKGVLELNLHSAEIRHLDFNPKESRLLSLETSRRSIVTQLTPSLSKTGSWAQGEILVDHRAQAAVTQALMSPDGTAILISTVAGQEIWDESCGQFSNHSVGDGRWLVHPADDSRLLFAKSRQIQLHQWTVPQEKAGSHCISLSLSSDIGNSALLNEWFSRPGVDYLFQVLPLQSGQVTAFLTIQARRLQPSVSEALVSASMRNMVASVKNVIAISRSSVVC